MLRLLVLVESPAFEELLKPLREIDAASPPKEDHKSSKFHEKRKRNNLSAQKVEDFYSIDDSFDDSELDSFIPASPQHQRCGTGQSVMPMNTEAQLALQSMKTNFVYQANLFLAESISAEYSQVQMNNKQLQIERFPDKAIRVILFLSFF